MYSLPPLILPCERFDTPSLRYLNSAFLPLQHPFGKVFDIAGYNIAWFDDTPPNRPLDFFHDITLPNISIRYATLLSQCYPTYPPALASPTLGTTNIIHPLPTTEPKSPDSSLASAIKSFDDDIIFYAPPAKTDITTLHSKIIATIDRLFFIQFTPTNTMRLRMMLMMTFLWKLTSVCFSIAIPKIMVASTTMQNGGLIFNTYL